MGKEIGMGMLGWRMKGDGLRVGGIYGEGGEDGDDNSNGFCALHPPFHVHIHIWYIRMIGRREGREQGLSIHLRTYM